MTLVCAQTLFLGILVSVSGDLAEAGPSRLEIEPNAIQTTDRVMTIEIGGVPNGQRVRLQVLQDCDGDTEPDLKGKGKCKSPLLERDSAAANNRNVVHDRLDFEQEAADLPRDIGLWLRVSAAGSQQGLVARFGVLMGDPCLLWKTLVDAFFGGVCDPDLKQALRRHRGPAGLENMTFEVRRIALGGPKDEQPEAIPVPSTRGATGVAWLDAETLAVTVAPTVEAEEEEIRPGLYRVPLTGGEPRLLWEPSDARMPTAPLALPSGGIAFARQRHGKGDGPAAYLSWWRDGELDEGVALEYRVHQLVGADEAGTRVLALTLGAESNRPGFLAIDLEQRSVEHSGYHHGLYHAAQRSPAGLDSAIALEDNAGQYGWDIVLVDRKGKWTRDLQVRRTVHDLLPAWRCDGAELAFLAEVWRPNE